LKNRPAPDTLADKLTGTLPSTVFNHCKQVA
jgi:hypothetical protein